MNLYDYIYVDLDKVISLYSQLTGGVVELREIQFEKGETSDNKRNYDFKVFKHDAGGTKKEIEQDKTTLKPHHALLQELETELLSSGHLLDLNSLKEGVTLKDAETRSSLKKVLCVKATGRIVIEDYERLKKISDDFPQIVKFINHSSVDNLKKEPAYQERLEQIERLENLGGDKHQKSINKSKVKKLKEELESIEKMTGIEIVPQWILDGVKTWVDSFLPNITNVRLYPFESHNDEHVFGNLDARNFSIDNSNALHFTYGSFPTENFTLLGIVTSVPIDKEETFDPMAEFQKDYLEDNEGIENGFRSVFRGFDGIESMIRTCRYPRILVHPLLLYRQTMPINE